MKEKDKEDIAREVLTEALEKPDGEVCEFTDLVVSFIASKVEEMMDDPGKHIFMNKLEDLEKRLGNLEDRFRNIESSIISGHLPQVTGPLMSRISNLETIMQQLGSRSFKPTFGGGNSNTTAGPINY